MVSGAAGEYVARCDRVTCRVLSKDSDFVVRVGHLMTVQYACEAEGTWKLNRPGPTGIMARRFRKYYRGRPGTTEVAPATEGRPATEASVGGRAREETYRASARSRRDTRISGCISSCILRNTAYRITRGPLPRPAATGRPPRAAPQTGTICIPSVCGSHAASGSKASSHRPPAARTSQSQGCCDSLSL